MGYSFSADEVFEMAKKIEQNGAAFYNEAAQKVEGEKEKKFLADLALMEENHEKIFEEMQKYLAEGEKASQVFEPVEEALLYLKAIADTKIFFKKASPPNDIKEILISALETERDSIIFYLGMKDMVPGETGKKRVEIIIQEEMGHIRLLSDKLSEYK